MARLGAALAAVGLLLSPTLAAAYRTEVELVPGRPAMPLVLPPDTSPDRVRVEVVEATVAPEPEPRTERVLSLAGWPVVAPVSRCAEPFQSRVTRLHGRHALLLGACARTDEGRVERVRVRVSVPGGGGGRLPLPEGWPEVVPEPEPVLVIVTTRAIVRHSTMLAEYVAWREADGLTVIVATQDDWDRPVSPKLETRADAIRSWLADLDAALGVGYVLLVGNPDPFADDVPMRLTHPLEGIRDRLPEEWVWAFEPVPTDHFYSDLTGDWDLDGDGRLAEFPDDVGEGGLQWEPDAIVGRIPVYRGDIERLDEVLAAIMEHERAPDALSRRRALLPAAFLGFSGQPRTVWGTYDETDDGAAVLDVIGQTILELDPSAELVRLYEEAGIVTSSFEHELPLERDVLIDEWSLGAGLVVASAHGGTDESYRSIWNADADEDGLAGEDEVVREVFIATEDTEELAGAPGAFTFHAACRNGWPEDADNLATALLARGAVATVASSRAAMGSGAGFEPAPELADADTMAFTYVHLLLEELSAGEALAYLRYGLPGDGWEEPWGVYAWLGKLEYNLYGDPLSSLGRCETDVDCLRGTLCRESGRCEDGYCARGELVDCSELDGPCATGRCDPEANECVADPRPDGTACDDGLFCTTDGVCLDGLCETAERQCPLGEDGLQLECSEERDQCVALPDDDDDDEPAGGCAGCAVARRRPSFLAWLRALL